MRSFLLLLRQENYCMGSVRHHPAGNTHARWHPTLENWIKVSFDTSPSSGSQAVGVGVVARNAEGFFLDVKCKNFFIYVDSSSAKAIAVLLAVNFAR